MPRKTLKPKSKVVTKADLLATIASLQDQLNQALTNSSEPEPQPAVPSRHGALWTGREERYLANYFHNGGLDLFEAGKALQRTPYAVFMKAVKLGLLDEENVYLLWQIAAGYIPLATKEQIDAYARKVRAKYANRRDDEPIEIYIARSYPEALQPSFGQSRHDDRSFRSTRPSTRF